MSAVCQWILWILASCFIYSPNTRGMINTYAASIGRYLAFGDLFSAIVLSVEIGYPGSKVYCNYFFFIISNGFVNKFLWTQPQWWILILCQIHQRSRPYIYCIDFGLSVFLFVLLSVASSRLLSYRKCRKMPRLHMMNNEKKWPGKFKVINQVQGQTEHQIVN